MVENHRGSEAAESYAAAVGMAIKALRTSLHTSQEELAYLAGLDRTYVSGIERGVRNPTVKSICKIAHALHISPSKIFITAEQLCASEGKDAISHS